MGALIAEDPEFFGWSYTWARRSAGVLHQVAEAVFQLDFPKNNRITSEFIAHTAEHLITFQLQMLGERHRADLTASRERQTAEPLVGLLRDFVGAMMRDMNVKGVKNPLAGIDLSTLTPEEFARHMAAFNKEREAPPEPAQGAPPEGQVVSVSFLPHAFSPSAAQSTVCGICGQVASATTHQGFSITG